ncbi:MAG TPA: D-alanyl-D-alanine carboxypeptidase [Candidatus Mediterraneibacter norfolkensis]|nr:D-alanyl-D-alanine carboxypeptidase [Candidatus Mediterraneibacter norfolkensis]
MKCTNSKYRNRKRRRRRRKSRLRIIAVLICLVAVIGAGGVGIYIYLNPVWQRVVSFEKEQYDRNLYQGAFFAQDLCVAADDVKLEGFEDEDSLHAAGLFNLDSRSVVYGYRLYDRLFPASTTKIMTAYLALKYGNPDDIVTVSEHATDFRWDEVTCGLQAGDQISLYDLLCGLLLRSGNDCGTAIAEHISGSEEAFAELMNTEAKSLGATGTHFVNPHGLHDEDHYTTAYDLYLIFNECVRNETFMEIISMDSYTGTLTGADGTVRNENWVPSNYYSNGTTEAPDGIHVLGGKTGTTDQAGCCVILYSEDMENHPYISVIMGAGDKNFLYQEMNRLFTAGITG